ncbi:T4 family baseplate hub assembly chaperone [Streptosporangium sp. NPDC002607]
MTADTTVRLPAGLLDAAGACLQEADVRPVRGEDEEWLYALPLTSLESEVVTGLLARCVSRIGPAAPTNDMVGQLPVGDREWLILRLWRLTFGNRVELVLACPRPACAARMDVDFALDALPVEERPQRPEYRFASHDGPDAIRLRFRLPRGADLEALGRDCPEDTTEEELAATLLGRCVLGTGDAAPALSSPQVREALAERLRAHSALVQREFDVTCPACGREFSAGFDPILAFLAEMMRRRPEFDRDVHLLSLYYHWPLSEILAMPRPRRRRYVRRLLDQLEPAPAG